MAVTRFVPAWSTILAGAAISTLTSTRLAARLKALGTIKKILGLLLLLNWRSLPFVWHVGESPQREIASERRHLCSKSASSEQSIRRSLQFESIQLTPLTPTDLFGLVPLIRLRIWLRGVEKVLAIANSPFDTKVITKGYVGFDAADWNGQ